MNFSPNRFRRFAQALVMSAELSSDIKHLHAHFIHTPASVCAYCSLITGLDWTCSAHAKDIWTSSEKDLSEKIKTTGWVSVCTQFGAEHLKKLAKRAGADENKIKLIYHGLDLERFAKAKHNTPSERNGEDAKSHVRLISVGSCGGKERL